MQHTLKLTITAVGENDSVFLTPCDPVTLHESCVEDPATGDDASEGAEPIAEPADSRDVLSSNVTDDVMVMIDE